jgi:hypothetical protein
MPQKRRSFLDILCFFMRWLQLRAFAATTLPSRGDLPILFSIDFNRTIYVISVVLLLLLLLLLLSVPLASTSNRPQSVCG